MYTARRRQSLACDQTARRVSQQRHKTLLLCVVGRQMCLGRTCKCGGQGVSKQTPAIQGRGGKKVCRQLWPLTCTLLTHTHTRARISLSHTHTRTCLQSPKVPINMHVFHQSHCPTFARTHWLLRDALWPWLKRETLCTHAPGCTALWALRHGTVGHPLSTLDFITCPPSLLLLWNCCLDPSDSSSLAVCPVTWDPPPCTRTHSRTHTYTHAHAHAAGLQLWDLSAGWHLMSPLRRPLTQTYTSEGKLVTDNQNASSVFKRVTLSSNSYLSHRDEIV